MLNCKCTPTDVSNKSDVCVTIVYKILQILIWTWVKRSYTQFWKQKWKCKSLGYILRSGKLNNTDSMFSTCIQFLMKSRRYSTDQESHWFITIYHPNLLQPKTCPKILISSSYLCLGLPINYFLFGFPNITLYSFPNILV